MKTMLAYLSCFFAIFPLFAQTDKGATPLAQSSIQNPKSSVTSAVVVGISNYQDPGIPDLQFADRDAEAFAAWLRSPAGGSVPERNIKFLANEQATTARFAVALDGLIETAKEGDYVIIYFSGHGDVETKTLRQNGFLLCHDSPASTYMAGAYALTFLQDVVTTLSQQNKAKVTVITDACRAGKLAGSSINGAQLTSSNLAKQFADEVKILSCQPNEFSLEGEQWGGGRGLFSYHLLDGLTGLADKNGDGSVSLFEVGRYLDDRVPTEAAPHSQLPLTVGDRQALLATVDAPALADLRSAKSTLAATLKGTGMRGWEDDIVAAADSATQVLYYAFADALKNGEMLDSNEGRRSAADLLPQLLEKESLRELHGLMRRNLAAALQDEAQQALNSLLNDDPYEQNQWQYNPDKYAHYPAYLAKAIELLGEQHYMYRTLMAKKFFFEAKRTGLEQHSVMDNAIFLDSLNRQIRNLLHQGLKYDPNAAYLYCALENTFYANAIIGADSFFYYHDRAIELSPTWMLPRKEAMNNYLFNVIQPNWQKVEKYALEALALNPESYMMLEKLAWLYQRMFKMDDAVRVCQRMTALRPDLPNGYNTLGSTYMVLREYEKAQQWSLKALEIDSSTLDWTVYNLARVYKRQREYAKLFHLFRWYENSENAIEQVFVFISRAAEQVGLFELSNHIYQYLYDKYPVDNPGNIAQNRVDMGSHLLRTGQIEQAAASFHQAFLADTSFNSFFITAYDGLAQVAAQHQLPDSAIFYFQKAINYHFDLLGSWGNRSVFAKVRYHYSRFLLDQNRPADAEAQLLKAEETDPRHPENYYGMAIFHAHQKHQKEALNWLAKALEWYYPDYDEIMAEPLFQKIRKTKRFKALMQQYFPNGSDKPLVEKLAREYLPEIFK